MPLILPNNCDWVDHKYSMKKGEEEKNGRKEILCDFFVFFRCCANENELR
jgi:hypothetical protein